MVVQRTPDELFDAGNQSPVTVFYRPGNVGVTGAERDCAGRTVAFLVPVRWLIISFCCFFVSTGYDGDKTGKARL